LELDALKLHTTADPLRRLVNSGFIDTIERNEVWMLTAQGESTARFALALLRTGTVKFVQVALVREKEESSSGIEGIHWVLGGC
jgi:Mn-dependent DtxR family transcriptional regulator